jgi:hypothetical protein
VFMSGLLDNPDEYEEHAKRFVNLTVSTCSSSDRNCLDLPHRLL